VTTMSPRPLSPKPTRRQAEALTFLARFKEKYGYPPTLREIGMALSIGSTNGVRSLMLSLERDGFINRVKRISRGIEIARKGISYLRENAAISDFPHQRINLVPVLGKVSAGFPQLAIEDREEFIRLDKDLFPYEDTFTLKVKGDSMKEAGIYDGDWVLARPNLPLNPGDIVVAIIGEEATVKRYVPMQTHIRLEPANPQYPPIIIDPDREQLNIVGKVVGLIRKF
ncbi:MAG: transcriptional repressor LexA, partial [bacterium]